ncbi:MAG: M56 family metallopeptidase, partial [Gemmatimonadetes bacterium]|nr:M56 family metallopeptidase [Gemmatimonadota bacterium]
MVAAWMVWSLCVGLVLCVAALAMERLLTLFRLPTRGAWVAAGAGTVLAPAWKLLATGQVESAPVAVPVIEMDPLVVTVAAESGLRSLDDLLLTTWVFVSAFLLVAALLAGARLLRHLRTWAPTRFLGRDVLLSADTGPAVVGFVRPRIVLPLWTRTASPQARALILAHEEEHLRAKDPLLRFLAGVLVVLCPWNPALWFQFHRLGLALELDCDRRVMRRMPDSRRAYGDLLLQVGSLRQGPRGLAVAALSEEPSLLERRIRDLVWKAPQARFAQAGLLGFGVLLAVSITLLAPSIRSGFAGAGFDGGEPDMPEVEAEAVAAQPPFTPFTKAPELLNRDEIRTALEAEYPPLLREAGVGGTAKVWFFIDEKGLVQQVRLNTSSGHDALDQAALRVAVLFRFSPGLNRDQATAVWVSLDIRFQPPEPVEGAATGAETRVREQVVPPPPLRPVQESRSFDEVRKSPTFTPFTVAPDILNRSEIQDALENEYPSDLQRAGIGGTAKVWFFLDATGAVRNTRINSSSGHEALDRAALRVADLFRFTPALNRGEPVPVW